MEEVNKNTKLDNTDKKLHISDVIKSLDELISKEERIVKDLALDKLFKSISYCEQEKLTKYKY